MLTVGEKKKTQNPMRIKGVDFPPGEYVVILARS